MIYLLLSICCSTIIVLIFKSFTHYKIESFQAIVFNYMVCLIIGLGSTSAGQLMKLSEWSGLPLALTLGVLFIVLFYLIARTTQLIGVAVASTAQKLSFVVPVVAGIAVFHEAFSVLKVVGFLLAILAIFLVSAKGTNRKPLGNYIWLPVVVFLGSGVCDLVIKVVESFHLGLVHKATFSVVLFGTAFVIGFIWMLSRILFSGHRLDVRSILAGMLLGVPNYGSIYYLITALESSGLEASQVFPINNVGIILLSAAMAWLLFQERLNKLQLIGLAVALISILILL